MTAQAASLPAIQARYLNPCVAFARRRFPTLADVETLIADALTDVILQHPQPPAGYVFAVCRHLCLNALRSQERRDALHGTDEPVADWNPRGVSDYSRRAAAGVWHAEEETTDETGELAAVLEVELSGDDRMLVDWVAHGIPQAMIARWLGLSHAAVRKRLQRLRQRLGGLLPDTIG